MVPLMMSIYTDRSWRGPAKDDASTCADCESALEQLLWHRAQRLWIEVDLTDQDGVMATVPGRCNCCKTVTSVELVCGDLHICPDRLGEDGRSAFTAFRISTCNPMTVQRQNSLVRLAAARLNLLQSLRMRLDTATTRPKLMKLRTLVSANFGSFCHYLDTVLRRPVDDTLPPCDYTHDQQNMQAILAVANAS